MMKRIVRESAWLAYKHFRLSLITWVISILVFWVGVAGLVNWLWPIEGERIFSIKIAKVLVGLGCLSLPIAIFLGIGLLSEKWQKIPKIAKAKAQEILKGNPQLNPPINNHVELVKWLESYEALSSKEKELATTTEQLNKLPEEKKELEANKEKVEKEIGNLKSELGMS